MVAGLNCYDIIARNRQVSATESQASWSGTAFMVCCPTASIQPPQAHRHNLSKSQRSRARSGRLHGRVGRQPGSALFRACYGCKLLARSLYDTAIKPAGDRSDMLVVVKTNSTPTPARRRSASESSSGFRSLWTGIWFCSKACWRVSIVRLCSIIHGSSWSLLPPEGMLKCSKKIRYTWSVASAKCNSISPYFQTAGGNRFRLRLRLLRE
jgi:hypothetical protein